MGDNAKTMENNEIEQLLEQKEVKPTVVRVLVARELAKGDMAMSLSDLEMRLGSVDKSSIFRALSVFLGHHVVHRVDDGTGQSKYALWPKDSRSGMDIHHAFEDEHIHFHCERCGHTYCLPDIPLPEVKLPEGFHVHDANMVFTGLCPDCNQRYGCKRV